MSDDLIKATAKALPDTDLKEATCEPISLGGSDRSYYRINLNNDQRENSWYERDKPEIY